MASKVTGRKLNLSNKQQAMMNVMARRIRGKEKKSRPFPKSNFDPNNRSPFPNSDKIVQGGTKKKKAPFPRANFDPNNRSPFPNADKIVQGGTKKRRTPFNFRNGTHPVRPGTYKSR